MYQVLVQKQENKRIDDYEIISYFKKKNIIINQHELLHSIGQIQIFQGTKLDCNKLKQQLEKDKNHFKALDHELQYLDYFVEKVEMYNDIDKIMHLKKRNELVEKIETLELLRSYNINSITYRYLVYHNGPWFNNVNDLELEKSLNLKINNFHGKIYLLRELVHKILPYDDIDNIEEEIIKLNKELNDINLL